jgi:hypothetical protein
MLMPQNFVAFFGATQKKFQIGNFSQCLAAYDGCMNICTLTSISISCATSDVNTLFSTVPNQCLGSNLPLAREPFGVETGDLTADRVVRPRLRRKRA